MSAPDARASAPDAREEAAIREIAALLDEMVRRDYPAGRLARRDAHAKAHGLVRAEFRVDADVPADLRHGLFAEPRTYPAWIRFSNGAPRVRSDRKRDQRGMAIKVLDVPGEKVLEDEREAPTQDFVLASCPRFFIRSVADYLPFTRAAVKKPAIRVLGFFVGWNPFRWRLHELRALAGSLGRAASPLATRYWSQTPYRLGPLAVKYSARPLAAPPVRTGGRESPDFLRDAMADQLGRGPAVFEFQVQAQGDPDRMPIEDSTVEWSEAEAPFRRVATITIPAQTFDSDAQMALAEQLSFTPWHTRPEHAPLGGINRVRRVAYEAISRLRHDLNGVVRREPTSLEIDPALSTPRDGPDDAVAHVKPKGRSMTTRTRVSLAAVALIFVGVLAWRIGLVGGPDPVSAPPVPAYPSPEGHNGLSDAERARYYHLSEGGELYPLDWIRALETETTGQNGLPQVRPFLDNIERYGLLPDPKGPGNPFGLPVGVSVGRSKISGVLMIGLNCTACHVGELHYQGRAMRMDGGPNLARINAFITEMFDETTATMTSPRRLRRFWRRVREMRRERRALEASGEADTAPDETLWARAVGLVTDNRGLLEARIGVMRALPTITLSIQLAPDEGYGRLDAFGMGRDELFGAIGRNSLPPDAPVSFPHTWGLEYTGWLQWGANTNSVMERNIGQALGVGATFDPRTYESTVNLENLHELEELSYTLTPPAWPDFMPPIDSARAARGEALFRKYCVECHETFERDGAMRIYQKFALDEVGTDPATAINFERPVRLPSGEVRPFPYAALDLIKQVKQRAYQDAGFDQEKIDQYEQRHVRKGPQWDPTFRATLLDSDKWPDTRGRRIYRAKTLVGIWATAPFLHNGSVPTVYDLLKPAAERPVTFPVGQREYDPVKLGYQTDPTRFAWAPNQTPFVFDTRIAGNWNTGHEWRFYPELTDDTRYEIIEFLKTYTAPLPGTSGAR